MRYIGNIIIKKGGIFENNLYNIINDKESIIQGLPTLVIGWELTKELYPTANIIDWEIDENTYWTFGKREKRERYEKRVAEFQTIAIKQMIEAKKYRFINVLAANNEEKRELLAILKSNTPKNAFIANDMLYVSECNDEFVYGISLRDIDYEGGDKKKIFNILYSNPSVNIVKQKENFTTEMKVTLKNNEYLIPYLCE